MAKRRLTYEQVISRMREQQGKLTHYEFARHLGVSPAYLSAVYRGRIGLTDKVLKPLGLAKVELFEEQAA